MVKTASPSPNAPKRLWFSAGSSSFSPFRVISGHEGEEERLSGLRDLNHSPDPTAEEHRAARNPAADTEMLLVFTTEPVRVQDEVQPDGLALALVEFVGEGWTSKNRDQRCMAFLRGLQTEKGGQADKGGTVECIPRVENRRVGVAVAYVFRHLLPELGIEQALLEERRAAKNETGGPTLITGSDSMGLACPAQRLLSSNRKEPWRWDLFTPLRRLA